MVITETQNRECLFFKKNTIGQHAWRLKNRAEGTSPEKLGAGSKTGACSRVSSQGVNKGFTASATHNGSEYIRVLSSLVVEEKAALPLFRVLVSVKNAPGLFYRRPWPGALFDAPWPDKQPLTSTIASCR